MVTQILVGLLYFVVTSIIASSDASGVGYLVDLDDRSLPSLVPIFVMLAGHDIINITAITISNHIVRFFYKLFCDAIMTMNLMDVFDLCLILHVFIYLNPLRQLINKNIFCNF
jgi:hypothetical protein